MTQGWSAKQQSRATTSARVTNRLENRRRDFNELTILDKHATYHDKANGILGCRHYQRSAKLQAHCCGKWDTCRFCHDEVSDHNIVRNLITTMMCMYCATVQPAGQDCINEACGRRVAKYYCKECKLWDSDPRKNIYHCHDCGICRIGKGLGIDYFHCKKCNVCMAISLKGRHKCIERNLESDCPICGEYMFTSTTTVIFMPCGHCIHYKCHQEYIQTSYQCPTCLKSLADMTDYFRRIDQALAQQQMPQEYSDLYNQIYCNDCEKKCHAKFHFMYHKCVKCKGYNTKVLNTADKNQIPLEELRAISAPLTSTAAPANPAAAPGAQEMDAASVGGGGQEQPAASRSRSGSRTSLASSSGGNRRASMVQRGVSFWCHQCQASTHPVMVAGSQRCGTCDSDFLEQL
ncbi:zinc-ribbon-domain-containing protein [Powellomyces hirtus]|nr:zinc-ribbon-domain-containing protein [Powellomyces hirtus]